MIGVVQKKEFSKGGAPKIQIAGVWYFAGRTDVSGLNVGDKVEFTFSEFGEDRGRGRPKGLDKWRPVLNEAGSPETASTIAEVDILRSVSNVVGSACAAGTVATPEDLQKWFVAAWHGFQNMGQPVQGVRRPSEPAKEPEFQDDPLPDSFYENLPPPKSKDW